MSYSIIGSPVAVGVFFFIFLLCIVCWLCKRVCYEKEFDTPLPVGSERTPLTTRHITSSLHLYTKDQGIRISPNQAGWNPLIVCTNFPKENTLPPLLPGSPNDQYTLTTSLPELLEHGRALQTLLPESLNNRITLPNSLPESLNNGNTLPASFPFPLNNGDVFTYSANSSNVLPVTIDHTQVRNTQCDLGNGCQISSNISKVNALPQIELPTIPEQNDDSEEPLLKAIVKTVKSVESWVKMKENNNARRMSTQHRVESTSDTTINSKGCEKEETSDPEVQAGTVSTEEIPTNNRTDDKDYKIQNSPDGSDEEVYLSS